MNLVSVYGFASTAPMVAGGRFELTTFGLSTEGDEASPLPDRVSLRSCVDNWATAAYNIDVNEAYKGALSWHLFK
jgi:hypothetical protein